MFNKQVAMLGFWEESDKVKDIFRRLDTGERNIQASGLWGSSAAFFITCLKRYSKRKMLIVAEDDEEIEELKDDLGCLGEKGVKFFTEANLPEAITSMDLLLNDGETMVLTTTSSLEKRLPSPRYFGNQVVPLKIGQKIQYDELSQRLVEAGYRKEDMVEDMGQFSVRGEIFDIWAPNFSHPLRIIFMGDMIEEMRWFDEVGQRSIENVKQIRVLPAGLEIQSKKDKGDDHSSLLDYLDSATLLVLKDVTLDKKNRKSHGFITLDISILARRSSVGFETKPIPSFHGKMEFFVNQLEEWQGEGNQIFTCSRDEGEKSRLHSFLEEEKPSCASKINYVTGPLSSGFIWPEMKLVVITDQEIFPYHKIRRPTVRFRGVRLGELSELAEGDFTVHERYGIGRYLGLKRLEVENRYADYLALEYAKGDRLYVPIEDFNMVQKYIGTEGYKPKLYSLDSIKWVRLKKRVKTSVERIARELIEIASLRERLQGVAFPADNQYDNEFQDAFSYEETPHQRKAIEEVKRDMEKGRPMDRLVCGDVGYGKTEVAMRAAFKTVFAGKQVVLLAPTTILVEQHYRTFKERFAPYPVKIESLSRFKSKREQKLVIEGLKKGSVDIVIGTHRLIQKDIAFLDLGLLIIDEEHRFGVKQKERLKKMRAQVDILSLSATPIPRTLSMALAGIRQLSVIETAPMGRIPIQTYLSEYDEELVKMAVENELVRGGQVFYVHNRVETMESQVNKLKRLLPHVKIGTAHGKMSSQVLERNMMRFINREYDMLVSTTIVEAGLDIPNVNTMIIVGSQDLGLAQLYQLRGRIGRDIYKAYCYLFYPRHTPLAIVAQKRLHTIARYTELGAGFKIALQDLEIRGAGNILGHQQHGHILDVGFDLYLKLLEDACKIEKGIAVEPEFSVDISLPLEAYIPMEYVPTPHERITIYRRLVRISRIEELEDITSELMDRFGRLPDVVEVLLRISELRMLSKTIGIERVYLKDGTIVVEFYSGRPPNPEKLAKLKEEHGEGLRFAQDEIFSISFDTQIASKVLSSKDLACLIFSLKKLG